MPKNANTDERFVQEAVDRGRKYLTLKLADGYTKRNCIIVVEIGRYPNTVIVGTVVDAVSEVMNVKEEDFEDAPNFGTDLNTNFTMKTKFSWIQ